MSGFEIVDTMPEATVDEPIAPLPNESNQAAFFRRVKRLGKDAALGRDSLPQLVATIAEAVETGALDPTEKFDGPDKKKVSAANYVFGVYAAEDGNKSVHDRSKASTRAQASKIKQIIDACAKPNVYFREALVRAVDVRKGLFTQEGVKVKTAFDAYLDMARRQLKKDSALTDDEINFDNLKKDVTHESNVSKELEKAWRVLDKLLTDGGKAGVILPPADARFDSVEEAHKRLLEAIRAEKPDFGIAKTKGTSNGEDLEEEVEDEEADQSAEVEAAVEEGQIPVTPEVQSSSQPAQAAE